ncbi:hypothetical protein [Natrinema hispanicum]|uniref:hypothetical protein n=1 Tax=Natrinema hispanicum TaxID=392421 RepID=UPI00102B5DB9|nr:hypothetical protein [Natrinema hispanicum]
MKQRDSVFLAGKTARAPRESSDSGKGRPFTDIHRERGRRPSERADDRPGKRGASRRVETSGKAAS